MSQYDYQQLYLRKGGVKGPITLEPPHNFSEPYQSDIAIAEWHTHPTYDWWRLPSGEASLSLYNAGRLWVPIVESLDWTIVEVTLGPDSQRLVHGPCELKCCERTPEDKTYDIYLARGRVQREGLCCGTTGSWDLGRDLGWPREVQREGLRCGINGKLGLGCIDRGKKHDLGRPKESNGKAYVVGQREAGTRVYRSGTDGVVRGHWTCYLQMVCGTIKVYVLYVYSTEPVLSAELC